MAKDHRYVVCVYYIYICIPHIYTYTTIYLGSILGIVKVILGICFAFVYLDSYRDTGTFKVPNVVAPYTLCFGMKYMISDTFF